MKLIEKIDCYLSCKQMNEMKRMKRNNRKEKSTPSFNDLIHSFTKLLSISISLIVEVEGKGSITEKRSKYLKYGIKKLKVKN